MVSGSESNSQLTVPGPLNVGPLPQARLQQHVPQSGLLSSKAKALPRVSLQPIEMKLGAQCAVSPSKMSALQQGSRASGNILRTGLGITLPK